MTLLLPSLRRRPLWASGPRVIPVAIGGNAFGWTAAADSSFAILDEFRELGGNLVSTADTFAAGQSEQIIGDWIRARGNRDQVVVMTSIGASSEHPVLNSDTVTASIDACLARLGSDRIDVLFVRPDEETGSFEEALVAVDENVRKGKVLAVGACDFSEDRLIEARIVAAQFGLAPFVAFQSRYNLTHRREFEGAVASVVRQQGLGVLPMFALDGGFLAGNYRTRLELDLNSTGNIVLGGDAQTHFNRQGQRILAALDSIASEHECAPASIAIAWLLTKPGVVAPIVGASNAGQVSDLVAAAGLQLTRHQVAFLDDVSA